jgi:Domain of unknown function (DUF4388)
MNGLQGSLEKEQLFSLLSYLKLTTSTGRLEVIYGSETASIYIHAGEVVHAESGVLQGEYAVKRISTWAGGRFQFHAGEISPKSSISDTLEGLALSVAVSIDENRTNDDFGIDLDRAVRLASKNAGEVTLSGDDLMLLPKLNGLMTLRRAGQELGWAEGRLRSVVASLNARQMLEAVTSAQQAQNTANSGAQAARSTIDPRFTAELRQAFSKSIGPAAEFVFDDVCRDLKVNPAILPANQFSDFVRGLANAVDDNAARDRFIQALTELRAKYRI